MALPLSRSGACRASELASILAGTVMNQKRAPPATASTAMASSSRRMVRSTNLKDVALARIAALRQKRGAGRCGDSFADAALNPSDKPSTLLRLAIGLVAVVAGGAHVGKCHLELIERLRLVLIVGDRFCEGRDLRLEVGLVLPNF